MINFQEQAAADLDAVFFNAEALEFATKHKISGSHGDAEVYAVIDRDLYTERALIAKVENANLSGMLFFMKTADWKQSIGALPKIGERLRFDSDTAEYLIENVNDDMGMLEITLTANVGVTMTTWG